MNIPSTVKYLSEHSGKSIEEIKHLADKEIETLSGLIDLEGALNLVSKNLQINLDEMKQTQPTNISNNRVSIDESNPLNRLFAKMEDRYIQKKFSDFPAQCILILHKIHEWKGKTQFAEETTQNLYFADMVHEDKTKEKISFFAPQSFETQIQKLQQDKKIKFLDNDAECIRVVNSGLKQFNGTQFYSVYLEYLGKLSELTN